MIPRIFVSSTYYDLKHVRERIEKFLENYGFEPVLFESDKVTYQIDKSIDQSAYYEVSLCHIMVLIIGGRYGTPATQTSEQESRKNYDEFFISITRKEFETARQRGIPIIIFIDKSAYAEFQTYRNNMNLFHTPDFKPSHVDNINVFKFIEQVNSLPVKTFEKIDEIENYLKSQFAGYFFLYLESLKNKIEKEKIIDAVSELNYISLQMNEVLTSVGKKILAENYEDVIDNQFNIIIEFFVSQFLSHIEFENLVASETLDKADVKSVARTIYNITIKPVFSKHSDYEEFKITNKKTIDMLKSSIASICPEIVIKSYNFRSINRIFQDRILPIIKDANDESKIIDSLEEAIRHGLMDIPF